MNPSGCFDNDQVFINCTSKAAIAGSVSVGSGARKRSRITRNTRDTGNNLQGKPNTTNERARVTRECQLRMKH